MKKKRSQPRTSLNRFKQSKNENLEDWNFYGDISQNQRQQFQLTCGQADELFLVLRLCSYPKQIGVYFTNSGKWLASQSQRSHGLSDTGHWVRSALCVTTLFASKVFFSRGFKDCWKQLMSDYIIGTTWHRRLQPWRPQIHWKVHETGLRRMNPPPWSVPRTLQEAGCSCLFFFFFFFVKSRLLQEQLKWGVAFCRKPWNDTVADGKRFRDKTCILAPISWILDLICLLVFAPNTRILWQERSSCSDVTRGRNDSS